MKNKMIQVTRTSGARHLADSRQRSYPPLTYLQMTYEEALKLLLVERVMYSLF